MNILTLSTYPIDIPRHGGQLRLRSIVDAFRAAGHRVQVAGVLGSSSYPSSEAFEPYPGLGALVSQIENPFLMDDWAIGELYSNDDSYFKRLAGRIRGVPDLIHVEQPWLFEFARRFARQRCGDSCRLLYGSQNVEHVLKRDILNQYLGLQTADAYSALVLKTELHAIANAHGIACVSDGDLGWVSRSASVPVVLAQNGVSQWKSTQKGRLQANHVTQGRKFALYCASAHPPNVTGFFDMLSGGVGCVAPDELIVIVGGAGEHVLASPLLAKSVGLSRAVVSAGIVDEECLHGFLDIAHCFFLPLTHGGGTNLKTAEALWSGRHIVSTSVGMRGFERFRESTGVQVVDSPREFKQSLRLALSRPPIHELPDVEREARRSLLWDKTLEPLVDLTEFLTSAG